MDAAYPEGMLALEADGYRWHAGRRAWLRDLRRRNRMAALGWRVLHVTHSDLRDRPGEVVAEVRSLLGGLRETA